MKIIVTGAAGFIGSNLVEELLDEGHEIVGIDNLNDYYSPELKNLRLRNLLENHRFTFHNIDIADSRKIREIIKNVFPEYIYHLAAQAGVRLPVSSFNKYVESNLTGFGNIAIAAAEFHVPNFLYASSSSVYGNSINTPYKEDEIDLKQVSFYGATKFANEILAKTLSNNSQTKFRGMRFFTVYGPQGRPDMAYFRLIHAALNNKTFKLFGDGTLRRDFTYVSDVVQSIKLLGVELGTRKIAFSDVVNIGGGRPKSMKELIDCINKISGNELMVQIENSVIGDVKETIACHKLQMELTGFVPTVTLEDGIRKVFSWASQPNIRQKLETWIA